MEVSVTNDEASDIAELDPGLARYERGHAMALHVRVSLHALIERGLACLSCGCVRLERARESVRAEHSRHATH